METTSKLTRAGNFILNEHNRETVITYKRSLKDWAEIVYLLALGGGAATFVIVLYFQTYFHQWIFWVMAALFGFLAVVKLAAGISHLRQPGKALIVLNEEDQVLTYRYPFGKKQSVDFSDIGAVVVSGMETRQGAGRGTKVSIGVRIDIITKERETITVALINPTTFVRWYEKDIENDVRQTGQQLAKVMAKKTGAAYEWTGFKEEKNGYFLK